MIIKILLHGWLQRSFFGIFTLCAIAVKITMQEKSQLDLLYALIAFVSFFIIMTMTTRLPQFTHTSMAKLLPNYQQHLKQAVIKVWLISILPCLLVLPDMAMWLGLVSVLTLFAIIFVAMIYVGGLLAQYPLGYISDRMDRRLLISALTGAGTVALIVGMLFSGSSTVLLTMAFMMGAVSNPLYSLLIAYVNDYLEQDDMAAASSGLLFLNGIGAILGPLIVGWMMTNLGPDSYFAFIAALFALISAYAAYRMTQRAAPSVEDTNTYAAIAPQMTAVAHEVAQEYAQDQAGDEEDT